MRIKFIKDEDFVNYKQCSMFIGSISCSFKCCKEQGLPTTVCQNEPWFKEQIKNFSNEYIIERYQKNFLTNSIVFGGLEPLDQFEELFEFIREFRQKSNDTIVIYTGYKEEEIQEKLLQLQQFDNIIVKVGRYIPHNPSRYDEVLGVTLASDNQYAINLKDYKGV